MIAVYSWLTKPRQRYVITLLWSVVFCMLLVIPLSLNMPEEKTLFKRLLFTAAHFSGFSIMSGLWVWTLLTRINLTQALAGSALICLPLALLTEYSQQFVPSRQTELVDYLANTLGITFALFAVAILVTHWQEHSQRVSVPSSKMPVG